MINETRENKKMKPRIKMFKQGDFWMADVSKSSFGQEAASVGLAVFPTAWRASTPESTVVADLMKRNPQDEIIVVY